MNVSELAPIQFDQVFESYNGKSGCMCGCLGKYTIPSHTPIAAANADTGWDAFDESNVSDRRVRIAVKKINDTISENDPHGILDVIETSKHRIYSIDDHSRTTVVYVNI